METDSKLKEKTQSLFESDDVMERLLDEAEQNAASTTKRYALNEVMTEAKNIINN